eukprot:scaffold329435_cov66-Tisochrysis_lutea.AAC.2
MLSGGQMQYRGTVNFGRKDNAESSHRLILYRCVGEQASGVEDAGHRRAAALSVAEHSANGQRVGHVAARSFNLGIGRRSA